MSLPLTPGPSLSLVRFLCVGPVRALGSGPGVVVSVGEPVQRSGRRRHPFTSVELWGDSTLAMGAVSALVAGVTTAPPPPAPVASVGGRVETGVSLLPARAEDEGAPEPSGLPLNSRHLYCLPGKRMTLLTYPRRSVATLNVR